MAKSDNHLALRAFQSWLGGQLEGENVFTGRPDFGLDLNEVGESLSISLPAGE